MLVIGCRDLMIHSATLLSKQYLPQKTSQLSHSLLQLKLQLQLQLHLSPQARVNLLNSHKQECLVRKKCPTLALEAPSLA